MSTLSTSIMGVSARFTPRALGLERQPRSLTRRAHERPANCYNSRVNKTARRCVNTPGPAPGNEALMQTHDTRARAASVA